MSDATTDSAARRLYQHALERAMRHAARQVPWDQAFEIAHDVASEMVRRSAESASGEDEFCVTEPLLHRAVTNRLRNSWRAARRRSAAEAVHVEERTELASTWNEPGSELETRELERVIATTLADMPEGMRAAFTLVRERECSYQDAATQLRVGIATIHTQISRANARLREAIAAYRDGGAALSPAARSRARGSAQRIEP